MQTEDGLRRVARESAIDLAADGVVYAEQRYAPEQHLQKGLSLQQVVDAVQAGFAEGIAEAASQGRSIRIGTLITAMRHADRGDEIAALALENRDNGVVGFDIAGAEAGFPPSRQATAFTTLRERQLPRHGARGRGRRDRVHRGGRARRATPGGSATGCASSRTSPSTSWATGWARSAHWVRDRRIPLELCPSSNVQTGAAESVATHPVTRLRELGFAVTVNTDNRLQSGTSMTRELTLLVEEAGWTLVDLRDVAVTAAAHSFLHHDERSALIDQVIRPGVHGGARRPAPRLRTTTARTPPGAGRSWF